jgi:hypothetical protein
VVRSGGVARSGGRGSWGGVARGGGVVRGGWAWLVVGGRGFPGGPGMAAELRPQEQLSAKDERVGEYTAPLSDPLGEG